ncbi:MAG: sulfotransferase [Fimbriimonas sp.]|nr:sulfotransferase [Fimbriimonas sp.]
MSVQDQDLLGTMVDLAADQTLDPSELELLHYALGKSLEDLGDFKEAFRHYDLANEAAYTSKFGDLPFDPAKHRENYDFIRSKFSAISCQREPAFEDSLTPIFVVGMMRSGTSLMEQILSSHLEVSGAGEQRYWPQNFRRACDPETGRVDFSRVKELAEGYINRLSSFSEGKRFVVDKMPNNYMYIGLIRAALPQARIIHVRRHPIDTCVSIYATQNPVRIRWAHKKAHIVLNYQRYLSHMEHWRQSEPSGSILEVQYENLVTTPEPVIRTILEYCGLSWKASCLRPEDNQRGVTTPSLWQVRQPMYQTSIGRWQRFEPWIGELASLSET